MATTVSSLTVQQVSGDRESSGSKEEKESFNSSFWTKGKTIILDYILPALFITYNVIWGVGFCIIQLLVLFLKEIFSWLNMSSGEYAEEVLRFLRLRPQNDMEMLQLQQAVETLTQQHVLRQNALENGQPQNPLDNRQHRNVFENGQPQNPLDNIQQRNALENIQPQHRLDNIQRENVLDNLRRESILDDIQQENALDNIQQRNALENIQPQNRLDNIQRKNVLDNFRQENTFDDIRRENALDNICRENALSNIQQRNALENIQPQNRLDNIQLENVLDNFRRENTLGDIRRENALDNICRENVLHNIRREKALDNIRLENVRKNIQLLNIFENNERQNTFEDNRAKLNASLYASSTTKVSNDNMMNEIKNQQYQDNPLNIESSNVNKPKEDPVEVNSAGDQNSAEDVDVVVDIMVAKLFCSHLTKSDINGLIGKKLVGEMDVNALNLIIGIK